MTSVTSEHMLKSHHNSVCQLVAFNLLHSPQDYKRLATYCKYILHSASLSTDYWIQIRFTHWLICVHVVNFWLLGSLLNLELLLSSYACTPRYLLPLVPTMPSLRALPIGNRITAFVIAPSLILLVRYLAAIWNPNLAGYFYMLI